MQTVDVVLNAFESKPPKLSDNADPFTSYPKYLPKYKLLPMQMEDPKFCISFMLQLMFLFESFKKPVSAGQKQTFVIGESEKRTIDQAMKRIYKIFSIINPDGRFESSIKQILRREESIWTTWTIKGCNPFEKPVNENVKMKFLKAKEKAMSKMKKGLPQKLDINFRKLSKSKADQMSLFKTRSTADFKEVLVMPVSEGIPENPHNPLMGELLERVFTDLEQRQGIEKEYTTKNDPVLTL